MVQKRKSEETLPSTSDTTTRGRRLPIVALVLVVALVLTSPLWLYLGMWALVGISIENDQRQYNEQLAESKSLAPRWEELAGGVGTTSYSSYEAEVELPELEKTLIDEAVAAYRTFDEEHSAQLPLVRTPSLVISTADGRYRARPYEVSDFDTLTESLDEVKALNESGGAFEFEINTVDVAGDAEAVSALANHPALAGAWVMYHGAGGEITHRPKQQLPVVARAGDFDEALKISGRATELIAELGWEEITVTHVAISDDGTQVIVTNHAADCVASENYAGEKLEKQLSAEFEELFVRLECGERQS